MIDGDESMMACSRASLVRSASSVSLRFEMSMLEPIHSRTLPSASKTGAARASIQV